MDKNEKDNYQEKDFLINKPLSISNHNMIQINLNSNKINPFYHNPEEYDEKICFDHYYFSYQKFQYNSNEKNFFPFLISNEYEDSCFNDRIPIQRMSSDSIESILLKIKIFVQSPQDKFKMLFIDNIQTYSEIIGLDKTEQYLLPSLSIIVDDSPGIKTQFLLSLQHFIDYLSLQGEKGIRLIRTHIFNIINTLYQQDHYEINNEDVIQLLYSNVLKISQLLSIKDSDMILSMILNFSNSESKEKVRIHHKLLSIKLMKNLVLYLNKDCCDSYLIPQFYCFSFDDDTVIRINIMRSLSDIVEVCSLDLINTKILKIVEGLSKDLIWNVRKSCVEEIPKIMRIIKKER